MKSIIIPRTQNDTSPVHVEGHSPTRYMYIVQGTREILTQQPHCRRKKKASENWQSFIQILGYPLEHIRPHTHHTATIRPGVECQRQRGRPHSLARLLFITKGSPSVERSTGAVSLCNRHTLSSPPHLQVMEGGGECVLQLAASQNSWSGNTVRSHSKRWQSLYTCQCSIEICC